MVIANNFGKVPPQARELEEAVLGAILLEKENQDVVFDLIRTQDVFYVEAHQVIFEAIKQLYDAGKEVDLLTVTERLRKNGKLEIAGGAYGLTKLTMAVMSSAHVEDHSRLIVEKYKSRELIRISSKALGDAYDDTVDVFDLIDATNNEITRLTADISKSEPEPTERGAAQALKEIENQSKSDVTYTGVTTGFKELDEKTSGWQKGNMIVLAARPAVGKTSFAINLAMNAAMDGKPVAFFSLEMSKGELIRRMFAALSGVPLSLISNPHKLKPDDLQRLKEASEKLRGLKIYIDDTAGLNNVQLRAKARRLKAKHGIELIILDYLQLMENTEKGLNREQQVSQNSRRIKLLAKDLEVPIIALSQLNRGIENDKNRTPNLSDLRESGAIEQDADIVMFLSNPSQSIINEMPIFSGKILLKLAKGRSIGLGSIPLDFNKEIQLWSDVERRKAVYEQDTQSYEEKKANQRLAERGREMSKNNPQPATLEFNTNNNNDDLPF